MATGHTRYPVVGETTDEVLGIIDLHAVLDAEPTATARSRCRPAVQVPSSLSLPDTLRRLADAGDEMALLMDEYGGFAGLVTSRTSPKNWLVRSPTNMTTPTLKSLAVPTAA